MSLHAFLSLLAILSFSIAQAPQKTLLEEVKRNCSIDVRIEINPGLGFQTWYNQGVLERMGNDCELCGRLAKYLFNGFGYGSAHQIGFPKPGSLEDRLGDLYQIGALYHEMGHIEHGDSVASSKLKKRLKEIYLFKRRQQDVHDDQELSAYTALLAEQAMVKERERIALLTQKGKEYIASHKAQSILCRYIYQSIGREPRFWNSPLCNVCLQEMTYKRALESRADLFAFDKLWLNGRLDVMIALTYFHGSCGYIVASARDVHPSGIERALFMIGYMNEKGIDVEKQLSSFEHNPVPEMYAQRKRNLMLLLGEELIQEHMQHSH